MTYIVVVTGYRVYLTFLTLLLGLLFLDDCCFLDRLGLLGKNSLLSRFVPHVLGNFCVVTGEHVEGLLFTGLRL